MPAGEQAIDPRDETPLVFRVITRPNIGGPARQEIPLAAVLRDHGFPSELVWGSLSRGEGALPFPPGTPNTHLPSLRREVHPVHDGRAFVRLRALMRARRPQIVHTHMAKAGALGRLAARRARVPVIIHTFHGHVLEGYFRAPVQRAIVEAERRLARHTDALLAVSPAVRDELLEMGIGRPAQWHVVPVGLDLRGLLVPLPPLAEARRRLGLPVEGPLVGIVGRLVPIKDHVTFLDAAARLALRHPDLTFAIAGDGELRPSIEARAAEVLGTRVRFLGWVSDLPALYSSMDVVVLTSMNEGTPVSLIEAGAAGKPVVTTAVGGVPDVVIDGVTGLLTPRRDPQATAGAVGRLLEDPDLARSLGSTARQRVPERFSIDRLAGDLADLYAGLLAGGEARRKGFTGGQCSRP